MRINDGKMFVAPPTSHVLAFQNRQAFLKAMSWRKRGTRTVHYMVIKFIFLDAFSFQTKFPFNSARAKSWLEGVLVRTRRD